MTDPSSFYRPDGEPGRVVATELTRGPWSEHHQHGGPPVALMAQAIERADDDASDWLVARVTSMLLRPLPIAPLRVEVEAIRRGRRAQWWRARLRDDAGEVLATATGSRIRRTSLELPPPTHPLPAPLRPVAECEPFVFPFFRTTVGYHTAVEVRVVSGQWGRGPAAAWIRPRFPLVEGEETSSIARVVTAADAANGVAYVLDARRFVFVNPDLTVTAWRPHRGEWVGLDTRAVADPGGAGICEAQIHDEAGAMGRSLQTLVIDAR